MHFQDNSSELAAVRAAGLCDLEAVEAVVLETDGSFSMVSRGSKVGTSSLTGVRFSEADATKIAEPSDETIPT